MLDFRPVLHICGLLLLVLAAAMLLPALADLLASNPDWQLFIASAIVTAFAGGTMVLGTRGMRPADLSRRTAFLLTAGAWVSVALFGSLPFFFLPKMDFADALFEAISGITTTGSTVLTGLDRLPPGILLWRALLQWIGGVGIIVMAIIMLPYLGVGGMQLFQAESSERGERIVPRARQLVAYIVGIYAALTGACIILYWSFGMSGFDGIAHALTTLSTGGYSTHDASFSYFQSSALRWTATLFMLSGAIPFVAYIRLVRGDPGAPWKDVQVRGLVAFLALVILVLAVTNAMRGVMPFGLALRESAFNVVSIVTTTGYASSDYSQWGAFAVALFFALIFIGGCTGSTAGGIKIYRFQVFWIVVQGYMRQLVHPHRAETLSYSGRSLPREVQTSVLAFLAVFVGAFSLIGVALAAMGLDFITAFSASATALANVGPGLGPVVGPSGTFATLPDPAKLLLCGAMLLGRLELFTILILFVPDFWRR